MNRIITARIGFWIGVLFCQSSYATPPKDQVFMHVTWPDQARGWIWIQEGRIKELGAGMPPPPVLLTPGLVQTDFTGFRIEPGHLNASVNLVREGLEKLHVPFPEGPLPSQISTELSAEEVAQAILTAQTEHLAQGVTAVYDETLDARVMSQMARLEKLGLLKMRVWAYSYGRDRKSRSWMQSIAGAFAQFEVEKKLHYGGELYLSPSPTRSASLTDNEIEEIFLLAGHTSVRFKVDTAAEALRLAEIRHNLIHRRSPEWIDSIEGNLKLTSAEETQILVSGLYWVKDTSNAEVYPPSVKKSLGKIARGYDADFAVYDLNQNKIQKTIIHGEIVYDKPLPGKSLPSPAETLENTSYFQLKSYDFGQTILPLVGYDASTGVMLGGAYFTYPFSVIGQSFSARAIIAPTSLTGYADLEWMNARGPGQFSPKVALRANSLTGKYFGFGNSTNSATYIVTQPMRADILPTVAYRIDPTMELQLTAILTYFQEGQAPAIVAAAQGSEGAFNGFYNAGRLEWTWDQRDNPTSTRTGGRRVVWTESWITQASAQQFAQRSGFNLVQFFPVHAPDWILGFRLEGAALLGYRSYLTAVGLGGGNLRGYLSNRFRGEESLSGSVELRYPIWKFFSGVLFTECGRLWSSQDPTPQSTFLGLHPSGGGGLRIGLPPDYLVKLRLDYGVGLDQTAFALSFNEAF